jgi:type II secretory pathway component PulF
MVILPQFRRIFVTLKSALPASTQLVLKVADAFTVINVGILVTSFFVVIVLCITLSKTPAGRRVYDNFLVYTPGIRFIYHDLMRAQSLQSLSLLLRSGRTLTDSLIRVAHGCGNSVIRQQLEHVQQELQLGKPFTQAIYACPLLAIP